MSDTQVTGANYVGDYSLIRGQFVKQIKAVCDIHCQNIEHSTPSNHFFKLKRRNISVSHL